MEPSKKYSALYALQRKESTIDFEGKLAMLFFTRGCNFRCGYCHNPDLLSFGETPISYSELSDMLKRGRQNWADAVNITGGEPCAQKELPHTAAFIKEYGFALKIDTNGSFPETLAAVLPFCDYIAMDYKAPIERYEELTGTRPDKMALLSSLKLLKKSNVPSEIRITVIPGFHKETDISQMCSELSGINRLVLQSFVPRDNLPDKALRNAEKLSPKILANFASLCRKSIEHVTVR